jgi:talin
MFGAVKAVANGDDRQVPLLRQACNDANVGLSGLIAAAKRGAIGEVAMDKAIENINASIAKLNTQSIFAQAGQLEPDKSALGVTVQKLQGDLQEASQKLSSIAGNVQRAVRGNEEDLARAASDLANAVAQVASASEKTASRIQDSLSQQDVLSSAKSLAIASHQLILAAKDAQRLPNDTPAQHSLSASVKGVAEAATSLMTSVQRSAAESERGERELEARKQQLQALMKHVRPVNASAEEVVGVAREVLTSTADLVFANDQGSLIEAGNTAYNSVEKLLAVSAGAARLSSDDNVQKGIKDASIGIGRAMVDLLEVAKLNRADNNTMPKLDNASAKVTTATQQLVEALRKLPNAQNVTLDDKGDLDKVAEEELLKCANIIKEAARALEAAKPERKTPKIPGVLDRIDIDTAIVDAAQAIANATGVLVQHAYGAQRERLEKRRQPGQRYRNDPTWANGLISASHGVADSVQSLVKAANKAATGMADEEELVATARAVASSTAHLVSASRAKADPNSASHKNLSDAAKSVANATSCLVAAATKAGNLAAEAEAQEEIANLSFGGAASKAKEMESQIKILKLEKELEKERMRMLAMRKTKK